MDNLIKDIVFLKNMRFNKFGKHKFGKHKFGKHKFGKKKLKLVKKIKKIKKIKKNNLKSFSHFLSLIYLMLYSTDNETNATQFFIIWMIFVFSFGKMLKTELYNKNDEILDIIKIQIYKFFDKNKSCIIKKNEYMINIEETVEDDYVVGKTTLIDIKILTDVNTFNIGLKKCENKKNKYKGQNIITSLRIYYIRNNIETLVGHSVTLVFNKKSKSAWIIDPGIDIGEISTPFIESQQNLLFKRLKEYFKPIKYDFKGYYPYIKSLKENGDMCLFVSALQLFITGELTKKTIKENLLNYIKWEYHNLTGNDDIYKTDNKIKLEIYYLFKNYYDKKLFGEHKYGESIKEFKVDGKLNDITDLNEFNSPIKSIYFKSDNDTIFDFKF